MIFAAGSIAVTALAFLATAGTDRRAEAGTPSGAAVVSGGARSRIDWTRGLVIETGAAAGDLRAPSPGVARVAAEREARQAARARLAKRAAKISLASGGRVSARAGADEEVARRLARAVERSVDLSVEYASDGSVVLVSGLPLEAIRLAVEGAVGPPVADEPRRPTALVVDATGALKKPLLGIELAAGAERYAGPTIFYRAEKAALRDPRVGDRPAHARAKRFQKGKLWLARGKSGGRKGGPMPKTLANARESGALVVILLPK
jgi:hypothetical protein